ncbi:MAG TPA: Crp/Fnr family transcriptional regulator [Solibacterales bacterium]|nr:Crp/Fnr family transcriptional regulator [Bryobacterales bacterium]
MVANPSLEPDIGKLRSATFAKTQLLTGLTAEEREGIAVLAGARRFSAGEPLFYEGDPCEGLWVIASGSVKIVKTAPSGREITLAVESAPSSVAEVPLFDGGTYPASTVAVTDGIAFVLHKSDFHRFCEEHPQVPMKVLAVVGKRLRQLVGLIESVTFGSVRQRVARTLLEFSASAGADRFALPVTHEEFANRLGTVREVVSRNLSRFQSEGMIRMEKGQVRIMNRAALEAEAEASL